MRSLKTKKGQSLIDYIFLFTAVILIVAGVVAGTLASGITSIFDKTIEVVENAESDF